MIMRRTCTFLFFEAYSTTLVFLYFWFRANTNQMMAEAATPSSREADGLIALTTREAVRAMFPFSEGCPFMRRSRLQTRGVGGTLRAGARGCRERIAWEARAARSTCQRVAMQKCESVPATDRVCALPCVVCLCADTTSARGKRLFSAACRRERVGRSKSSYSHHMTKWTTHETHHAHSLSTFQTHTLAHTARSHTHATECNTRPHTHTEPT